MRDIKQSGINAALNECDRLRAEVASLKEKYEIALNRIVNFEDMVAEHRQQLAAQAEEIATLKSERNIAVTGMNAAAFALKLVEDKLSAANERVERMRELLGLCAAFGIGAAYQDGGLSEEHDLYRWMAKFVEASNDNRTAEEILKDAVAALAKPMPKAMKEE
jgi:aminopeptidase N